MAIVYKVDVLALLKQAGWSSYRLLREHVLPGSTVQKLRNGQSQTLSMESLDKICNLLHMQPGDLIEYVDQKE